MREKWQTAKNAIDAMLDIAHGANFRPVALIVEVSTMGDTSIGLNFAQDKDAVEVTPADKRYYGDRQADEKPVTRTWPHSALTVPADPWVEPENGRKASKRV